MADIFPFLQPEAVTTDAALPLAREIKWNFDNNVPVFSGGVPVEVTGIDAVAVWAWKALHTDRYRWPVYTWDYGCEARSLIGQAYTEELKESEAARCVRECLLINPYITDVADITTDFADGLLTISCRLVTIYGEETLNV
jgi:hypothetical protein